MVTTIVAVCASDPDVAVTVTVAVVGGGGFVAPLLPPPPHAEIKREPERRNAEVHQTARRRFLQISRQLATASMVPDENGPPAGWAFDAEALAAIVSCVVAELPEGMTLDGLKAHVRPTGRPEQAKVTAALNPFCGVMVRVIEL